MPTNRTACDNTLVALLARTTRKRAKAFLRSEWLRSRCALTVSASRTLPVESRELWASSSSIPPNTHADRSARPFNKRSTWRIKLFELNSKTQMIQRVEVELEWLNTHGNAAQEQGQSPKPLRSNLEHTRRGEIHTYDQTPWVLGIYSDSQHQAA